MSARGSVLKVSVTTDFVVEECVSCGVLFAMTEEHKESRVRDKSNFYCPNGHSMSYRGKSFEQELRDLRNERDAAQARALAARDQLEAAKREAARLAKRASAGVCPCCKRSFTQLRRHMASKHPEHAS